MAEIKVYTTPACPWCNKVKDYLKEKGVQFREIDVASDMNEAVQLVERTGRRTVPVIEIGDQIIVGFNREKLEELL